MSGVFGSQRIYNGIPGAPHAGLDIAAAAGETIGAVGATGLATGAHLHWGLSWLDVRLDPESVLGLHLRY